MASGAWSFAFSSISNIEHLLHHTRPEHSYTPFDASKHNQHTYTLLTLTLYTSSRHLQTIQRVSECYLWTCVTFGFLWGWIWVFRPCSVQQMLNIGISPKGKIAFTWRFWDIKIPKPPYLRSQKTIGFLHFFKIFGSVRKILQSTVFNDHPVFVCVSNVCKYNV